MTEERKDLSPAELELMEILWKKGCATAKEIQAAFSLHKKPAYTTIATVLSRMREKGYVDAQERNFAFEYRPLVAREQVVRRKIKDLVERVLGGDIKPLAAYIAEDRQLTAEQIKTLEDILRSKREAGE
ncbi:MAG: BlaI/MecI/CopY family transcriptional regulator [Armatimonadota bacterium]